MKKIKTLISSMLIFSLILSMFSGCAINNPKTNTGNSADKPDINVTVIDGAETSTNEAASMVEAAKDENASIASMVYSAVSYDLQSKGFDAQSCVAATSDASYEAFGLGYYNPDFQLFDKNDYTSVGFLTVANADEKVVPIPEGSEYVAVEPIGGAFNDGDALYHIMTYSCEDISSGHFIFKNKYVIYYQQDSTTVRFETYENKRENYNLSLGSLYDFDKETFIYDADLFDGYETHSAIELFSKEDYVQLEKELHLLSEQQETNGYIVEELNIVYISPESIEAYLASEEEDTFFGYSVSELESSLGKGTALVYTENGFEEAKYFETDSSNYNWKSFLTKIGIGCGIILIGAVLAPVTGGTSFSCALITISKVAVTSAMVQTLGTLTVGVASGMMEGRSFLDSLKGATFDGLDAFSNGFEIGAVIGSVGVCSGLIKPTACFVAGTMVSIPTASGIGYVPIERIKVGDVVFSYNLDTGLCEKNTVTETFVNQAKSLVTLYIDGETITTTGDHPFYSPDLNGWVSAASLATGDHVFLIDDTSAAIMDVQSFSIDIPVEVYNFAVDSSHTYYVGTHSVLVHNECNSLYNERNKAIKEAWKNEVEAVQNGTSKYNWTENELKQLLDNGKVAGYDGCHIVDVSVNPALAGDANNIIFLKRFESFPGEVCHFMVHSYDWKN
ncbi:MAG TPA: hypothetical protein DCZ00_02475, partial [Lactococcus sp.]|nr:hypothetical protein [Lactococcus sp.]